MIQGQLKSGSERGQQVAFFMYCAIASERGFGIADRVAGGEKLSEIPEADKAAGVPIPSLKFIYATPNGGSRGDNARSRMIRGSQLKAEGVKAGVPDIFFPSPTTEYAGLYIEMKKKGGKESEDQIKFGEYLTWAKYAYRVCVGFEEAVLALKLYLNYD